MTNPLREAAHDVSAFKVVGQDNPEGPSIVQRDAIDIIVEVLRRYATCPTCNGSKKVEQCHHAHPCVGQGPSEWARKHPCPDCDGTGWNPQRVRLSDFVNPINHVIVIPIDYLEHPPA